MAIAHNNLVQTAELALLEFAIRGVIAGVPGGYIIHQHLDVMGARRLPDRQRVRQRGCQWLLHHRADAVVCGYFDCAAMIADRGVDQDGLRMRLLDHRFDLRVEEFRIEMKLILIAAGQCGVRLFNADQLNLRMIFQLRQKARNVAMHQAHDGDTNGTIRTVLVLREDCRAR